MFAENQNMF